MTTPDRSASRIRSRTNLSDLLDDGEENASDLAGLRTLRGDVAESQTHPPPVERTPRGVPVLRQEESAPQKGRISLPGALIGLFFIAGGTALVLFPVDMFVFHDRMRYLHPFYEHVTAGAARGYGIVGCLFGVAIFCLSLVRLPE